MDHLCSCGTACDCNCGCSRLSSCACDGCKCGCACGKAQQPVSLAAKIAAMYLRASAYVADVQKLVRDSLEAGGSKVDWSWDTKGGAGSKGVSGNRFSLSGQPEAFKDGLLIGGVLVVGHVEEVKGADGNPALAVDLEAGYYHKLPGAEGTGQFDQSTAVDLGTYLVDPATVQFASGESFDFALQGLKQLVDDVVAHPPAKAQSKSKPAIQKREELRRVREMSQQNAEKFLADRDAFMDWDYVADLLDNGRVGPAELNQILQRRGESAGQGSRDNAISELAKRGITLDPGQPFRKSVFASAAEPWEVAESLRLLADGIDLSDAPSVSAVAAELRRIVASIG